MRPSTQTLETIRPKAARWLRQGISPPRLALTLALGFVIGCIPLIGLPTGLCALIALAFRLNQPAIQAANYAAMPFQIALIVPFVRLGGKLVSSKSRPALDFAMLTRSPLQLVAHSPERLMIQLGTMAAQALLAWLLIAIPLVVLLTPTLTALLRRVPALAEAEAAKLT